MFPVEAGQNISFAWSGGGEVGVAGYRLYFGVTSGTYSNFVEIPAPVDLAEPLAATVTGLELGVRYYFSITAFASDGMESDYSGEISYRVPASQPPPPPPVVPDTPPDDGPGPDPDPGDDGDPDPGPVDGGAGDEAVFLAAAGAYNGLMSRTDAALHEQSGSFALTATARGSYSGRMLFGGQKIAFRGSLGSDGRSTNVVVRPTGEQLTLKFGIDGGEGRLDGWVVGEGWVAPMGGDRNTFHAKTNPAPFAASYTVTIPPPTGVPVGPKGHGYGTVRVDTRGVATFVGMLADGSKATQKVPLSPEGYWPFHLNLYKGTGSVLGWLVVNRGDVGGVVRWIKPPASGRYYSGGLTVQSSVIGSRYVPLAAGDLPAYRVGITCRGGGLLELVHSEVLVLSNGRGVVQPGEATRFSIAPTTGLFKGAILDPGSGRLMPFGGVILQKWNVGSGIVIAPTDLGYVGVAID